jgi:hypothetical protein
LGTALAFACSDFEPESFILSGNISNAFSLFEEELKSYMGYVSLNNDTAYVAFAGKGILMW